MDSLRLSYTQGKYEILFRFGENNSKELSDSKDNFEEILDCFLKYYRENLKVSPSIERIELQINCELPKQQKRILEAIVGIHNQMPEIYEHIRESTTISLEPKK